MNVGEMCDPKAHVDVMYYTSPWRRREAVMHRINHGVNIFQREVFEENRASFERLGEGQRPQALFITCSDSRINPNQITQTGPGDLFILRNAGNIIPPYGDGSNSEAASIEYAIMALDVEHIVVCGHSHCGAMRAVVEPEIVEHIPSMKAWLRNAETTRRIVRESYPTLAKEELHNIAIQENVLCQLDVLRTHPSVAARISQGKLRLHAWVFKLTSGEVFAYDPEQSQFRPLLEIPVADSASPRVLSDALYGP
ncbi:carbonic anhydrase [soil metagenome]